MAAGVAPREDRPITDRAIPSSRHRRRLRHPNRRLRRSTDGRVLGGVCGGVGDRLGLDPTIVRIAAVVLALVAGGGLAAYVGAWLVVPLDGDDRSIARRVLGDRRELRTLLAVASALLALVLGLQVLGLQVVGSLAWPIVLAGAGLLVVWRGAGEDERRHLRVLLGRAPALGAAPDAGRRKTVLRAAAGLALAAAGLGGVATVARPHGTATGALLAAVAVIGGFAVAFGPWWLRTLRDLTEERRERVRAEERAEMAAHLHDSVLQTLALIQKSAGDPPAVTRLARAQERELRAWLFGGAHPGGFDGDPTTVASAVASIEREVEAAHGVVVETVVVGDCPLDDRLRALLAAGREAAVNAAKWSGAPTVSVFAEVEPHAVSLFVRDRGRGFDARAVPADRRGIARSICDRTARHGGRVELRSVPGEGTEVELVMPRQAAPA